MKQKLIILVLAIISSVSLHAQTSYSCYYQEYCEWNSQTKKFENCKGTKESSLFEMNEKETMFTHTTESLQSAYYVKSKKYDAENKVWLYTVKSDVGNTYIYIFDAVNKEIRILITSGEQFNMVRFYVKSIF
jgi:hypothetical protein